MTMALSFTYQWQSSSDNSDFTNVVGETTASYTIPSDQTLVDKYLRVQVISTDSRGGTTTKVSASQQVANVEDEATGDVTISGTVEEGSTVSADVSGIGDVDDDDGTLSFTYQWQSSSDNSDFTNVVGETTASYTIPSDQTLVDKYLRVQVISTDSRGGTTTKVSASQQVANVEDEATGDVTISGTVEEGSTVSADVSGIGDVDDDDGTLSFTYQWQSSSDNSDFTNVVGETTASYTIPSDQTLVDKYLRVQVISTDSRGGTTTKVSASQQVANVEDEATGDVTISGTVEEGSTVSADVSGTGDVDDDDGTLSFTYQWQYSSDNSDFTNLDGETTASYTIPSDQTLVDKYLRVQVISTDSRGGTTTKVSASQQVANVEDEATGDVTISGTVEEGSTVSADVSGIGDVDDDDGTLSFTYQWQSSSDNSDFTNVVGETTASYTIPSDQTLVDKYLRVQVISTDSRGGTTTKLSASQQVANVEDEATGDVTISGTVEEGSTVSADVSGIGDVDDDDGTLSFTYQWQSSSDNSDFTNVVGETTASYTIPSDQTLVDKYLRVQVISTDSRGGTTTKVSASQQVANVEDEATGDVTISGTVEEGSTVSADVSGTGDVDDDDGTLSFTYQWQYSSDNSDFTNLDGETTASYTIPSDQTLVDKYLRVQVTSTDSRGGTTTKVSASQQVVNVEDEATGDVTISGTVEEGSNVTAFVLGISDEDGSLSFTYQWQSSSSQNSSFTNIDGATSVSYSIPSDQTLVDKYLRVQVISTDSRGGTTTKFSASQQVANVEDEATGDPIISGTVEEGSNVTAFVLGISDEDGPISFTYQWQSSSSNNSSFTNIDGATSVSYSIPSDQTLVDKYLRVQVISTDSRGGTTTKFSASQQVANVEDEATGDPIISGTVEEGSNVTAFVLGISDEDGTISFTYQWQSSSSQNSSFTNIDGATSVSYSIPSDLTLVDKYIRVQVISTDSRGGTTTKVSASQQVANVEDEATGDPIISGTVEEGSNVTAFVLGISDEDGPISFTYQWQSSSSQNSSFTNIDGATSVSYSIPSDQTLVDKYLRVQVISTDSRGGTTTKVSASQQVANVEDEATGDPIISGTVEEGSNVTAFVLGISDEDGPLSFTYQWQSSSSQNSSFTNIDGATSVSYSIPSDQTLVDKYLRVQVISTDSRGGTTTKVSASQQVANVEDEATGDPIISGTVEEGSNVTAFVLGISDEDGTLSFTYQWQSSSSSNSSFTNIDGATSVAYSIPSDLTLVDKYLRVQVISTDSRGGTTTKFSASQQVANVEDEATGDPIISGSVAEGSTVSADVSGIADEDDDDNTLAFTYQWQSSSDDSYFSNIDGATSSSYAIPTDQSLVDKYLRVQVISTDSRGGSTTKESVSKQVANVEDEATGDVTISGTVEEGSTVSADVSGIVDVDDDDGTIAFTYQWQSSSDDSYFSNIDGATSSSYAIPSDQSLVDKYLRVQVISTDSRGGTTTKESASQQVANVEDEATGDPIISGTVEEGSIVTAFVLGISDEDGPLSFTYQWQSSSSSNSSFTNIDGATSVAYSIPSDQTLVDKYLRVQVISTDSRGGTTTKFSASQQVANVEDEATGDPIISGTVEEGSNVTAFVLGISDEDGPLSFTYQWQSSSSSNSSFTNIDGATSVAYSIPSDQTLVDKYLRVQVISTDSRGGTTTKFSASQQVANVEDEATGDPIISGTVEEGSNVTAFVLGISDEDGPLSFTYQWQSSSSSNSSFTNIDGATSVAYSIPSDQTLVDKYLRVQVISTDSRGGTTTKFSASQQVANVEDEATGDPIISGTVEEGSNVTAFVLGISDEDGPLSFTYQWQSSSSSNSSFANIIGATSVSYSIPSDQTLVDKYLRVQVISTDSRGGTTTKVSASQQVANVEDEATGDPIISGTVEEGSNVTAFVLVITDEDGPLSFAYQWQSSSSNNSSFANINGATSVSYSIPSDQTLVDKYLRVQVISTDSRGGTTTKFSASQQVANVEDEASGTVNITGTVAEGYTLSADVSGLTDVDGTITYSYTWQISDNANNNFENISDDSVKSLILNTTNLEKNVRS